MELNDTETQANSSSKDRSVFYCPNAPKIKWDLNETTSSWILVGMKSFASPAIILLNALIILIVKRDKRFQKNSYILISSLAVADLLVGVVTIPLSGSMDLLLALQVSLEHFCGLDLVNVYSMYCISWCALYHLTAIAWERYVAIRKSIEYVIVVTRSRIIKARGYRLAGGDHLSDSTPYNGSHWHRYQLRRHLGYRREPVWSAFYNCVGILLHPSVSWSPKKLAQENQPSDSPGSSQARQESGQDDWLANPCPAVLVRPRDCW